MGDEEVGGEREMTLAEAARFYAEECGFAVFPLKPGSKEPATPHGYKDASKDPKVIDAWWKENPRYNIGIATGQVSGVIVLDVDDKHGGRETLATLEDENGRLPDAPTVLTPGGGQHIYFRDPGGLRNSAGLLGKGLDVRADGGYVVAPPSKHPNGNKYLWDASLNISELASPEMPAWLLEKIKTPHAKRFEMPARVPDGHRSDMLFKLGRSLKAQGFTEGQIRPALIMANESRCDPPGDKDKVEQIAHNAATLPDLPEFTAQYNGAGFQTHGEAGLSDDWPDPEPLMDALRPVKSLTREMLPAVFRDWLCDIADRYQAPLEYVAVPAIVAAGALVGRKLTIRPERYGDWCEVPNLWGVIVGRPGVMKSPMMAEALKPIYRFDREAYRQFQDNKSEIEFKQKYAEVRRAAIETELRKHTRDEKKSDALRGEWVEATYQEPVPRRYVVNDATVEKLGELLNQNPNGLLVVRDEMGALLARLDSEEHANERDFFLQAWTGKTSHNFDRIGRGSLRIDAACLSVIGGITPSRLDGYMRETFGGGNDDGLMQRFGLGVYPDLPAQWKHVDRAPDMQAFERATSAYQWLDRTEFTDDSTQVSNFDLPYQRLNDDARALFEPWRAKLEVMIRMSDEHPALLSHLSKYRTLVPALILVFRLLDLADLRDEGTVWERSTRMALAWAEVLESHARRIYQGVITKAETAAAVVAAKLRRGELPSPFRMRDIYRKHWTGLSHRPDIEAALEVLEDASWVRRGEPIPGKIGRPSAVFYVNPKVLA